MVTPLAGSITTQALSSSGNYFRLTRATSPQVQVKLQAPGGANILSDYPTVAMLRVQ